MVTSVGLNAKLLRPGLREVWGMNMKMWADGAEYKNIFRDERSTLRFEEYQELAGLNLVPAQAAGQNVSYQDFLNGYTTRAVNDAFGLGYIITREMIDDNQYKLAKEFPRALVMATKRTIENLAANILNRATTAAYTYGDGKTLAATDHPLPAGGTFTNRCATAADLSEASLEQAFIDIAAYVDSAGNQMDVKARKLIVHPFNRYTAAKLLGSNLVPETSNNAINVPKAENLLPEGYALNHYLTDSKQWYLLTDQDGMIFQQRVWPAEFRDDNDFESLNIKQATYFRGVFTVWNPRAIYVGASS